MNREYVLKNFWDKLQEAKKQNVREVRLTLKEYDDLGYCLYELLTEYYNKTIDQVKNNQNDEEKNITISGGEF